MELRNRALPIVAGANGTDGQLARMARAVAPEERATNGGQARQQHFEAKVIPFLGFLARLPPGPFQCRSGGSGRRTRTRHDRCGRASDLTAGCPAPAQRPPPKTMPECKGSHSFPVQFEWRSRPQPFRGFNPRWATGGEGDLSRGVPVYPLVDGAMWSATNRTRPPAPLGNTSTPR